MQASAERDLIFVSYSHQDRKWLTRLQTFLRDYNRRGSVRVWADPYIEVGSRWEREIHTAIAQANVGVLLITQNFLTSDFIMDVEVPALLAAAEARALSLVCIPISTSTVQDTRPELIAYQWARDIAHPLDELTAAQRNQALVDIAKAIVRIAGRTDATRALPPGSGPVRRVPPPLPSDREHGFAELHGVPPLERRVVERPDEYARLKEALLGDAAVIGIGGKTSALGLHGQGGIGKTTLARMVVHDDDVRRRFVDGVYWLDVGQEPNVLTLLSELAAMNRLASAFHSVSDAHRQLTDLFRNRKSLVVIDDVWQFEHARLFDMLGLGSRLLLTTRDGTILTGLGAEELRVDLMSPLQALALLAQWANTPVDALPAEAVSLVHECGYLPLAVKVAGAQIRDGRSCHDLLAALKDGRVEFLYHASGDVLKTLRTSVDGLSVDVRERYVELAILPEDVDVPELVITRLWAVRGQLTESSAREVLASLERKALLHRRRDEHGLSVVRLHDLQMDFVRLAAEDPIGIHRSLLQACAPAPQFSDEPLAQRLIRTPEDQQYVWKYAAYHLVEGQCSAVLKTLLLNPVWMQHKLQLEGIAGLLADYEWLRGDEGLRPVRQALRLSAHVVGADPSQLSEQLLGRLGTGLSDDVDRLRVNLTESGPRPRLHGRWPSLEAVGSPLLQTLVGHVSSINGALLLPDGRALSWSVDNTLRIWDLTTGVGRVLRGHKGPVAGALLLPDERALSWSADGALGIWDLATGVGRALRGHKEPVAGALMLPDGGALSWSHDGTLQVWDLTRRRGRAFTGHGGRIKGAMLLRDGRALSWSVDRTLRVWDLATGSGRALLGHEKWVAGALQLADGRVLSWSGDGTLRVWDLETEIGKALIGHQGWVNGALPLPDRQVLSWSHDSTLRIWDVTTGAGRALTGHKGPVTGALLLPDGGVLSWAVDRTLRVWDLATGAGRALAGHEGAVSGALLMPEERALSWARDGALRIWDLATNASRALTGHERWVTGALLLPEGRALSWSEDHTLRIWNLTTGDGRLLTSHEGPVDGALLLSEKRALSWSLEGSARVWDLTTGEGRVLADRKERIAGALQVPNGELVSWSHNGRLRVWDLTTGASRALSGHKGTVTGAVLLPDGGAVSWSHDGTLRVWDLTTGASRALSGHKGAVTGALLLPDGGALSWSHDGTLRVWDLATGASRALSGHKGTVTGALLLPDGGAVSWSHDGTLRIWDLSTGAARELTDPRGWVAGALLLSDASVLSWSDDGALRLWDLATCVGRSLAGHDGRIDGALLLPDGGALSWSEDRTLRVWDLAEGSGRGLLGHKKGINGARLLPDGRALSWSNDRTLRLWDLEREHLVTSYFLDAAPTTVLPQGADSVLVGDELGRIHLLEYLRE